MKITALTIQRSEAEYSGFDGTGYRELTNLDNRFFSSPFSHPHFLVPRVSGSVERPDPDVAEADRRAGIAVGLQFNWRSVERFVEGLADVAGLAF